MTFQNSILAGTTLVRDAISSEGFVSGSTGWSIERDGNAEFNDVSVRGTVEIADSGGTMTLNVDILGQPQIEFETPNGDQYQITADNTSLDIGALDNFSEDSSIHIVDALGIVLRSAKTGAPSILFDQSDGYLKYGSYAPWSHEDWHEVGTGGEPAFANSFTNLGSGWETLAFKKTIDGRVIFKGAILRSGSTADGTTIFTLPVGWRPSLHTGMATCNLSNNNSTEARVRVLSSGIVQCYGQAAVGTNTAMALDGISFSLI